MRLFPTLSMPVRTARAAALAATLLATAGAVEA